MTSVSTTADNISSGAGEAADPSGARKSRLGTCWTLYTLTLRQHLHGRRWMALALLFLLPAGLAIVIQSTRAKAPEVFLDFLLSWILIPQALLPLIALLYASGIIQDEQEDQTITYLLIRPLPKWLLYVVKMIATWTTTVVLVVLLTMLTYLAIYIRSDVPLADVVTRCWRTAAIQSLAVVTYCSIFGLVGLLTKRSLIVGVLYTVVIEGLLANLPLSVRMGTVIYYARIMAYRTLDFAVTWPNGEKNDVAAEAWLLDIVKDPQLAEHSRLLSCVLILIVVSAVCTIVAAAMCSQREFHVKTPEKD
jgi:ABC-2 type transport system permease protein